MHAGSLISEAEATEAGLSLAHNLLRVSSWPLRVDYLFRASPLQFQTQWPPWHTDDMVPVNDA